jgi:RNA polymerase sigma factor (sigma-70 family)
MNVPPEARSDQELWRAASDGSPEVWGELFARHHRAVYNYCFRRTGTWTAAEELTSAVFLQAWRRRRSVDPGDQSALPWLFGIATMLTRNHHRSLRRYRGALARVALPPHEPDPADEVSERLDAQQRAARLRERLTILPRRDREVLELAATGELSHAEIGSALGIPVGTVKSRLARARRRLAQLEGSDPAAQSSPQHVPLRR